MSSTKSDISTQSEEVTIRFISSLAILWLLVPFIIFAIKCYYSYLAIPTILISCYFYMALNKNILIQKNKASIPLHFLISALTVSIITVWLSGLIPPLGMGSDWIKHFSLMNLLTDNKNWPPVVTHFTGEPNHHSSGIWFLRYSIAFYEVPVLLESLMPIKLRTWLALYEIIGTTLFFLCLIFALCNQFKKVNLKKIKVFSILIIFIGFSGLDAIGTLSKSGQINMGNSLEWWGGSWFSFSSVVTQFRFAPQHCIPAWLGTILLYLNRRHKGTILHESIFLLLFLIFFWSPLVFIGLLLLFPLYLKDVTDLLSYHKNRILFFLMFFIMLIPLIWFFTAGSAGINKSILWDPFHVKIDELKAIFIFLTLESYIYIILIFIANRNKLNNILLINISIVFIICTMIYTGNQANDFSLKVSMPALTLLAIFFVESLMREDIFYTRQRICRGALIFFYCVGLITPAYEIIKGVRNRWDLSQSRSFEEAQWPLYFAPLESKPFFIKINPDSMLNPPTI